LATKDSVSWTEISNRPAGLDDGDDVGGGLWTPSGSNIYYNDGNIGIGITTPEAKLDISGDIILTGKIKIVKRYRYDYISGSYGGGHPNPRCSCDTSSSSIECGSSSGHYTNIDSGSTCYDWFVNFNGYDSRYGYAKAPEGPYVVKTFEYP